MAAPAPPQCAAARPRRAGLARSAAPVLAAAVLLTGLQFAVAVPAAADETPAIPPGTAATSPPPEVDSHSPGLKLRAGATLAPARVLDIVSVVETQGGEERRSDTSDSVTFALQAEVLFGKDSAKLSPDANARIATIADEAKKQGASNVRVFGFTDNLGTEAHGLVLSKQRAEAVQGVLEQQLSDAGVTYAIRGYGEQYPISDNGTEDGRKKNRRVEVSFPRGSASGASSDADSGTDSGAVGPG